MLSTSAAETSALMKATVMVKYLRQMLSDMGLRQVLPTTMHVDNKTAIHVGKGRNIMHETSHALWRAN